ncbi:hypothetical protein JJL45_09130 [Tamlana sp. s12]|uniref:hypothetical protein n=1 Tax=Tamlana sp. s12 TaxID=1630406 RepID=UPI0007FDA66C|nr:hypothetical protein [Tamlana sp. s12]OBQ52881.1 hypothetical protein VQ01_13110 [Tamlana sp. s12]QQY81092.1 hypothetical protein JJL45_09130 [Tamlana sp. s12]
MNETISGFIAAIGGSTLISSSLTFLLTKRKYNSEADGIEIRNLKDSLGVYQLIITDLKKHVDYLEKQQQEMRIEFNLRLNNLKTNN